MTYFRATQSSSSSTDSASASVGPARHATPEDVDIAWPAGKFYWCLIDAPLRAGQELPVAMRGAIDDDMPLSADELHAVAIPVAVLEFSGLPSGTLICALPHIDLASIDARARSLRPAALPPGLDATCELARINLLTGRFEPPALRRRRYLRRAWVLAALTSASVLLTIGLERRTASIKAEEAALRMATYKLADAARSVSPLRFAQTASLFDDAEMQADPLEQTATHRDILLTLTEKLADVSSELDASGPLAALLANWPQSKSVTVQTIRSSGDVLSVSALIEGDAAAFLSVLPQLPGWAVGEPRVQALGDALRIQLSFRRASEGADIVPDPAEPVSRPSDSPASTTSSSPPPDEGHRVRGNAKPSITKSITTARSSR
ncbi:MAG: hypothetical protein SFZ23_13375 [Planctomycetota bacterium]|nr:hypothetical protein [Planctomycetota bacterium]